MKKVLLIIIILIFSILPLTAETADYLIVSDILGTSAKMIRLGNIEGFTPYANILFENPSGLHRTHRFSASAFTTTFMDEVEYKNLAIAMRMPVGVLGIGYMMSGIADIPHTIENSDLEETIGVAEYFNYQSSVAKISYCLSQSRNLHFGISGSYFQSDIYTTTGKGYNFDAGVTIENKTLAISIAMRNIASTLRVNYTKSDDVSYSEYENLPLQTIYSLRYNFGEFTFYGQLKSYGSSRKQTNSYAVNYRPKILPFINISGGYKEFGAVGKIESRYSSNESYGLKIYNNFSLGIGLDLFGSSFDYAYEQSEYVLNNNKHYFSVAMEF